MATASTNTAPGRPLRVIGYCGVSTDKQGSNGYGLDAQATLLAAYCEQHGHELLTITTDVVSGSKADQMHGRAVAIAAIESGVADALLVRALDRATAASSTRRSSTTGPSATNGACSTATRQTAETRASACWPTYALRSQPKSGARSANAPARV